MQYLQMSEQKKLEIYNELLSQYKAFCAKGLSLDLSRGKPGAVQLDMLEGFLGVISTSEDCRSGVGDCRNYGILDGVPSAKKLFSELPIIIFLPYT